MRWRAGRSLQHSSVGVGVAAYALGIGFAGIVTACAAHRIGVALLHELAPPVVQAVQVATARHSAAGPAVNPPAVSAAPASRRQSFAREGSMSPTNDRLAQWSGRSPYRNYGSPFGSSSRNPYRPRDFFGGLFGLDDDRPSWGDTYRTVCVRQCDGYYFPISFSVTQERFGRDAEVCESRCGGQGRLFIYRNPGGAIEDMEDLQGRPYRQMRTAFLYRTEYVPSCKCQPHPWEVASRDRHRVYELAAAARKGSKEAMQELQVLQAKARQAARAADGRTAQPATAADAAAGQVAQNPGPPLPGDATFMRLGVEEARPQPIPRPVERPRYRPDPDWRERILRGN